MNNISFTQDGYRYNAISFDKTKMVLKTNQLDTNGNFIKVYEFRMGQIPKSVKKLLNPLK
jgi:hypothetical protein